MDVLCSYIALSVFLIGIFVKDTGMFCHIQLHGMSTISYCVTTFQNQEDLLGLVINTGGGGGNFGKNTKEVSLNVNL